MNHTPVPWIVTGRERDEQGPQVFIVSGPNFIATAAPGPNAEANARFIVRACNTHEQLLEALRKIEKMPWPNSESPYALIARAAITAAGG